MNPHPLVFASVDYGGLIMAQKLSSQITWEFTNQTGTSVVRYGLLNDKYYAQLIPGGFVNDETNPPRAISEAMFNAASKMHSVLVKYNSRREQ
jgi:hypothetical protein